MCLCLVCVNISNEELFFNAFPFENSYYLWIGLDVVLGTGRA